VNEPLTSVREEMRQGFAELHQGMAAMGWRLDALDERVRAGGALLEALRDQVQQLAEAHAMLDQRVERYRREHEVAHQEILALLRRGERPRSLSSS
jgi:chromosome segregation ATPase